MSVNEQVAEKLRKPVIKSYKRRKVYERFKDNILATEMEKKRIKMLNIYYV